MHYFLKTFSTLQFDYDKFEENYSDSKWLKGKKRGRKTKKGAKGETQENNHNVAGITCSKKNEEDDYEDDDEDDDGALDGEDDVDAAAIVGRNDIKVGCHGYMNH